MNNNSLNINDLIKRDPPTIIAEIGCNHKGDIEIAKEMIRVAKVFCDAQYVKFQKRNPKELLTTELLIPLKKIHMGAHMETTENSWNSPPNNTKNLWNIAKK